MQKYRLWYIQALLLDKIPGYTHLEIFHLEIFFVPRLPYHYRYLLSGSDGGQNLTCPNFRFLLGFLSILRTLRKCYFLLFLLFFLPTSSFFSFVCVWGGGGQPGQTTYTVKRSGWIRECSLPDWIRQCRCRSAGEWENELPVSSSSPSQYSLLQESVRP